MTCDCGGENIVVDLVKRRLIENQLDARDLRQHFARQVVLRRAEAAGGNHQLGAARGNAKGFDVGVEIVSDGRVPADGDADFRETTAEPLAVGVEVLAAGQFTADGDDFTFHARSLVAEGCRVLGDDHYTMMLRRL